METDVNGHRIITMGETLTCSVTGKQFVASPDGCSVNYAWGKDGDIVSDEGVDLWERNQLLDRSKPFYCYMGEGTVTGWKGNVLGNIVSSHSIRCARTSYVHGSTLQAIRVKDVHGNYWYGRGNRGIAITLRACKP